MLKELRKERKLSQKFVAESLGLRQNTYNQWENHKREPNVDAMARIAEFFGVSVDALFEKAQDLEKIGNIHFLTNWQPVPILGEIPAGIPNYSDCLEGYEYADVQNPRDYFYLRVKGNSMNGAGIYDNSLVLIHKQDYAQNGDIVACMLDGESATIKRYQKIGNAVLLMPENPAYDPIPIYENSPENDQIYILGVAVEVITKLKK